MAVGFEQGLFAQPTPDRGQTGGGLGGGASFVANAVNNATTLGKENVFDSITKPLRQRKRRQVHAETQEMGIKDGSKEYFDFMEKKLGEFGDLEGVETVKAKRIEIEDRELARRKTEADIDNINAQAKARGIGSTLEQERFKLEKLTTASDLRRAAADLSELDRSSLRADEKLDLDRRIVEIKEKLAVVEARNTDANTDLTRAKTGTEDALRDSREAELNAKIANLDAATNMQELKVESEAVYGMGKARAEMETKIAQVKEIEANTTAIKDKNAREEALKESERELLESQIKYVDAQGKSETAQAAAIARYGRTGKPPTPREVNKARVKQLTPEVSKLLSDNDIRLPPGDKKIFITQVAHAIEASRQLIEGFDEMDRSTQMTIAWERAKKKLTKVPGRAFGENDAVLVVDEATEAASASTNDTIYNDLFAPGEQ